MESRNGAAPRRSQRLVRFEVRDLRRQARRHRPWRTWERAAAGAAVGAAVVLVLRCAGL